MKKNFQVLILKQGKKDLRARIAKAINSRPIDAVLVQQEKFIGSNSLISTLYCVCQKENDLFFLLREMAHFQVVRDTTILTESKKEIVVSLNVWASAKKIKKFLEGKEKNDERGRYSQFR